MATGIWHSTAAYHLNIAIYRKRLASRNQQDSRKMMVSMKPALQTGSSTRTRRRSARPRQSAMLSWRSSWRSGDRPTLWIAWLRSGEAPSLKAPAHQNLANERRMCSKESSAAYHGFRAPFPNLPQLHELASRLCKRVYCQVSVLHRCAAGFGRPTDSDAPVCGAAGRGRPQYPIPPGMWSLPTSLRLPSDSLNAL